MVSRWLRHVRYWIGLATGVGLMSWSAGNTHIQSSCPFRFERRQIRSPFVSSNSYRSFTSGRFLRNTSWQEISLERIPHFFQSSSWLSLMNAYSFFTFARLLIADCLPVFIGLARITVGLHSFIHLHSCILAGILFGGLLISASDSLDDRLGCSRSAFRIDRWRREIDSMTEDRIEKYDHKWAQKRKKGCTLFLCVGPWFF